MSQYEFSEEQNVIIRSLTKWMGIFGGVWIITAAGTLLIPAIWFIIQDGFSLTLVTEVLIGIVVLFIALAFLLPLDNFRRIVNTSGNDIDELMTALDEMGANLNRALIGAAVVLPIVIIQAIGG
ncbi:MAG: hypothetical protein AAF614_36875 [Chloroflexota bacterium]